MKNMPDKYFKTYITNNKNVCPVYVGINFVKGNNHQQFHMLELMGNIIRCTIDIAQEDGLDDLTQSLLNAFAAGIKNPNKTTCEYCLDCPRQKSSCENTYGTDTFSCTKG